ncbi:hypothetical protein O3M35_006753 [Rhynocoris fuscipes]|uniref:Uncharacterized protein n=1 Tax=Rhynocoris fuscipes TaxID=488301 RepID=A0AAW1DEI2_9HEMI
MYTKIVILAVALDVALGGVISPVIGGYGLGYSKQSIIAAAPLTIAHAAPIALTGHAKQVIDYVDTHPSYKFEYAVHDAHTGDAKQQSEIRDGDVVHGSYSLVEPDGSKRIVEYTADDHNGFNAVVHRTPNAHPAVLQKVAVAAPIAIKAAPLLTAYHH